MRLLDYLILCKYVARMRYLVVFFLTSNIQTLIQLRQQFDIIKTKIRDALRLFVLHLVESIGLDEHKFLCNESHLIKQVVQRIHEA